MLGELFDADDELLIEDRLRPHWGQSGAIVFITMRTNDSIPKEVITTWELEKCDWMRRNGIVNFNHSTDAIKQLTEADLAKFRKKFNRQRETTLDQCLGKCVLRSPEMAKIVAESLMYFDGQRYRMGDFVVMPNHIHFLVCFGDPESMKKQCASWMHYTAVQINRLLGKKGKFWQQEPFDHLVRSLEQYEYLREYIRRNPEKARLQSGEFYYRRHES